MAMDPAEFAKFQAHLVKQSKWRANHSCPICGTRNWEAHGPLVLRSLDYERSEAAGFVVPSNIASFFPVVLLICKKCGFFRQFAWRPIEEGRLG